MPEPAESRVERHRRRQFERLVAQALDELPAAILATLDNVAVVVADEPTPAQLQDGDATETLFGLYEGIPLTERDSSYSLVLPDKVTIFRRPLEEACRSRQELMRQVRITVIHELAHHLGIDEDRLGELGWA